MELTFSKEPFPELTFSGNALARHGFTPGIRIAVQHQHSALFISVVHDNALWEAVCEASEHNPKLSADWVRDDGQLVVGGDWLTAMGITEAEHVDVATVPNIIIIRRRMEGILRA
ncbi:hypothetical protein [Ewingella allii]|uniref:hypothetical protein n=1 Tax=Ewingella allii TaxID=3092550 RepID=UPI00378B6D8C